MWSPSEKSQPQTCRISKSVEKKNKHNAKRKKCVKRKMIVFNNVDQNVEDHVTDVMDGIVDTETKLWHIKLGITRNLIAYKVVICMSNLKVEEGKIYDDSQVGKKTMMSHKKFQHLTRVPKLLHMDLIGPMQDESLGGKRYIFEYDDY